MSAATLARAFRKYGLEPEDYRAMVRETGGRCHLCGATKALVVDHDHDTGRVRGLLCNPCNLALGQFEGILQRVGIARIGSYLERGL